MNAFDQFQFLPICRGHVVAHGLYSSILESPHFTPERDIGRYHSFSGKGAVV